MKLNSKNLMTRKSFLLVLLAIVGINLAYYIYYILQFPHFIFDDYYIFYRIKNTPDMLFSNNPQEKFFLFFRPVTYLYYYILYYTAHDNAVVMKLMSLVVHICSTTIVLFTIKEYSELFKLKTSTILFIMLGIFISLNLDTFISVLWISNSNELLSGLLYSSIFCVIALFLNRKISSSVIFGILLNILVLISLAIKQNSAHLPVLLIILFFLFKENIESDKRKTLLASVMVMFVFVITFILLNTIFYYQSHIINGLENLYKKPFAIIGTMMISFYPFPGKDVYSYFIIHKLSAGLLLIAFLSATIWFAKTKENKHNIKNIVIYVFITVLIYFPRILAQSGERLNVIQIIFLSSMLIFMFHEKKIFILIVFGFAILSNIIESQNELATIQNGYIYTRNADLSLNEMRENDLKDKVYILWRNVWTTTPYSYYYNTRNDFGYDTTVVVSEISACNTKGFWEMARDVKITYANGSYCLTSANMKTYFSFMNKVPAQIIDTRGSPARGYSEITFRPIDVVGDDVSYIYYDDSAWVKMK